MARRTTWSRMPPPPPPPGALQNLLIAHVIPGRVACDPNILWAQRADGPTASAAITVPAALRQIEYSLIASVAHANVATMVQTGG